MTVVLTVKFGSMKVQVWKGRQQLLFRKNGRDRTASMAAIKQGLVDLKEEFE